MPEQGKGHDWSSVEERMEKRREEERAAMTPDQLAEDDLKTQRRSEARKQLGEIHKTSKLEIDEVLGAEEPGESLKDRVAKIIDKMRGKNQADIATIKWQEYEKVKNKMERFRMEHGITKSEEELQKEDAYLKERFGIE